MAALLGALALVAVVPARSAGAATTCAAAPAGMASVAVVVDTGSGDPLVRCVKVKEGSTGRDALVAAGVQFRVGSGTPADNNQGGAFLCGILGVPQTGCAAPSAKGVSYWAYYRQAAGAPWTYSRVGFFTAVGSRCAVEGWRWTTAGGVNAADNPRPRVAPPTVDCSLSTNPSTTAAPARPSPAAAAATVAPQPATAGGAAAALPTTVAPATTAPAAQVEGRTAEAPVAGANGASTTAPEQRRGPVTSTTVARASSSKEQAAGAGDPSSGGGVPWVAVGAVAVAALIGLGAFLRGRRHG